MPLSCQSLLINLNRFRSLPCILLAQQQLHAAKTQPIRPPSKTSNGPETLGGSSDSAQRRDPPNIHMWGVGAFWPLPFRTPTTPGRVSTATDHTTHATTDRAWDPVPHQPARHPSRQRLSKERKQASTQRRVLFFLHPPAKSSKGSSQAIHAAALPTLPPPPALSPSHPLSHALFLPPTPTEASPSILPVGHLSVGSSER